MVNVLSKMSSSKKRVFGFRQESDVSSPTKAIATPLENLKVLYRETILPLETAFKVLLLMPFLKSSQNFIRHL
ncbi:hypothetical protein MHBO_003441 [Bonamia ostreae]|uniref:Uncharacterized protein n=1 Tax=Bonamia ostreae TaxID=126728 RepID=A0ABV2AQK3_9EUKA